MTTTHRTPAQLIGDYRKGPGLLRDALAGLSAEQLQARPIPGKMSSREVACHIVDSDQFMCDRLKRTISTERPLLVGIESVDYVDPLAYQDRDLALDLQLLDIQREQMAACLERLDAAAWNRSAVHTENGLQTLTEILDHAVEHLEEHVVAIHEKRRALGV